MNMDTIAPRRNKNNSMIKKVVVALVLLVVIVFLAGFGRSWLAGRAVKSGQYQALFLTNGQVYFGHLKDVTDRYVQLRDIYYLQVQQQVQPGNNQSSQQPQVSLAKLGSELHGPEDVMYVAQNQVLFWENLKNDGKVVTAIKSYQSSHK